MYILVIDTATKHLSMALLDLDSKQCVASYIDGTDGYNHAKRISIAAAELLNKNNIDIKGLAAVAVNEGPGSFTGLRVGSSASKGFCFALDIPLIAVCGLATYGKYIYKLKHDMNHSVFVLLDARRGNYYYSEIDSIDQESIAAFDSLENIQLKIREKKSPFIYYLDSESELRLDAKALIEEVIQKWQNKDFVDIRSFEPKYIVNNYLTK